MVMKFGNGSGMSQNKAKKLGQYTGGSDADRTRVAISILTMLEMVSHTDMRDEDKEFVLDMLEKRAMYGAALLVTGRQLFWLRDVKDKMIAKGAL
jgi:hypothetical protein